MSGYDAIPGLQRANLKRLADSMGVLTYRTVAKKRVSLTYNEIRLKLHARLIGPNWATKITGTPAQVDTMLARMVDTARGKHGHSLRLSLYHIRTGKEAFAEAQRLYALPSRPYKRIEAAMSEARTHYALAAEFQKQHEASR